MKTHHMKKIRRMTAACMAAFFIGLILETVPVTAAEQIAAAPGTPENVHAESYSFSKIRVSWDPVPGAEGYRVYRAADPEGTYRYCYETDNPEKNWYINTNRQTGKKYWYRVRAWTRGADGKVTLGPLSSADSAYARPSRVEVTGIYSEGWIDRTFRLTWKPVPGASGYQISMKTLDSQQPAKESSDSSFIFCGNFQGTEGSVEIPDKTKDYVLRVRAYRKVKGKKIYGRFSREISFRPDWDEEKLKEAGCDWLKENLPQTKLKETLEDGRLRTPDNTSWSGAWPLRLCRYEPWEQVLAELKEHLAEDTAQYGGLPQSVCLFTNSKIEHNYVHIYLLH